MDAQALHAGRPWRRVVHISEGAGPRGGASWVLLLECGHRAFRPRRVPGPEDAASILSPVIQMHGRRVRRPRFTAPKKARCLWCDPL